MPQRLRLATLCGTGVALLGLALGTGLVLQHTRGLALRTAEASLARAASAVEGAINRQLLHVDGALASLPALLAAAGGDTGTGQEAGQAPGQAPGQAVVHPEAAARVLRSLNAQPFAFRDLLLVRPDGLPWAGARPSPRHRVLPVDPASLRSPSRPGAAAVAGPALNPATGEESLYFARPIVLPGAGPLDAVAEVPLPLIAELLEAGGQVPGLRVTLEREDGRLLAGAPAGDASGGPARAPASADPAIRTTRATLYGDVVVSARLSPGDALQDWARDRDRLLLAAAAAAGFVLAVAGSLAMALRQRARVEEERTRARALLESALECMTDGFVIWDAEDRLVTCNQRYRDMYRESAPFIQPGVHFEDLIREGAQCGQYPQCGSDIDAFVRQISAWHRSNQGTVERLLPDGRWVLITESLTPDGGVVGIRTDITALKRAQDDIRFMAHHDALTGLPNRVLFQDRLQESLRGLGSERGQGVALLYLDLDKFKDVNDTLGHPVGDALLVSASKRLRACVRADEVVARLGGDEFAVISVSKDPAASAQELGRRIIDVLGAPYDLAGRRITVGVSVGVALAAGAGTDADTLLKHADVALYRTKAEGRGTCRTFETEMAASIHSRLGLEADLRTALAQRQFHLVYQPVLNLGTDGLAGFEALLRWTHPTRGAVPPGEFIPLAEELGLIGEIGAWVLDRACADAVRLPAGTKVAVNLSPVQLHDDGLLSIVAQALVRSGLQPGRLELEITETALLQSSERTMAVLHKLRGLGLRIALDDFGTGYSSLSYLRSFPFDKLKVDRSFVREITGRPDCLAIVGTVAELARKLGIATTAEGVETAEQLQLVRGAGCTEGQGFLFGTHYTIEELAAGDALPPRRAWPRLAA